MFQIEIALLKFDVLSDSGNQNSVVKRQVTLNFIARIHEELCGY